MSFGTKDYKKGVCPIHNKKELVEAVAEIDGGKYRFLCCDELLCDFMRFVTLLPASYPHTIAAETDIQQQVAGLRSRVEKLESLLILGECRREALRLQIAAFLKKRKR